MTVIGYHNEIKTKLPLVVACDGDASHKACNGDKGKALPKRQENGQYNTAMQCDKTNAWNYPSCLAGCCDWNSTRTAGELPSCLPGDRVIATVGDGIVGNSRYCQTPMDGANNPIKSSCEIRRPAEGAEEAILISPTNVTFAGSCELSGLNLIGAPTGEDCNIKCEYASTNFELDTDATNLKKVVKSIESYGLKFFDHTTQYLNKSFKSMTIGDDLLKDLCSNRETNPDYCGLGVGVKSDASFFAPVPNDYTINAVTDTCSYFESSNPDLLVKTGPNENENICKKWAAISGDKVGGTADQQRFAEAGTVSVMFLGTDPTTSEWARRLSSSELEGGTLQQHNGNDYLGWKPVSESLERYCNNLYHDAAILPGGVVQLPGESSPRLLNDLDPLCGCYKRANNQVYNQILLEGAVSNQDMDANYNPNNTKPKEWCWYPQCKGTQGDQLFNEGGAYLPFRDMVPDGVECTSTITGCFNVINNTVSDSVAGTDIIMNMNDLTVDTNCPIDQSIHNTVDVGGNVLDSPGPPGVPHPSLEDFDMRLRKIGEKCAALVVPCSPGICPKADERIMLDQATDEDEGLCSTYWGEHVTDCPACPPATLEATCDGNANPNDDVDCKSGTELKTDARTLASPIGRSPATREGLCCTKIEESLIARFALYYLALVALGGFVLIVFLVGRTAKRALESRPSPIPGFHQSSLKR